MWYNGIMKKGQRMPQKQRDKISKKLKGHLSFMNGYKHPQEIRDKISKGKKGKHTSPATEFKKGHPFVGGKKGWFKKGQTLGFKNSRWKGGKIKHSNYVLIHAPNHPHNSYGYVREHRLVMEKHLGRYLIKGEVVHHINHIKNDNRIENLMLFSNQSKHCKFPKS